MSEVADIMADTNPPPSGADVQSAPLSVGQRLAQARSKLDLSVDQVAGQLKWSPRQIAEIEAGNYAVFPDMLTVRGFVRSYAKFLKVDAVPLLQEMQGEFERVPFTPVGRAKLDAPFESTALPWRHSRNPQKMLAGVMLAGLIVVAVLVYRNELVGAVQQWLPARAPTPAAVTVANPVDGASQVAAPVAAQVEQPPVVQPAETASATVTERPVAAPPVVRPPEQKVAVPTSQPVQAAAPVAKPGQGDQLQLAFHQDTWVQIRHADGSIVISHLYRAGEHESVAVDQPLNLVIGNAPGVVATLRGQPLTLVPQPGNNVASVTVK